MSEDNVTALFRCIVAASFAQGEEDAYRVAARLLHDLYVEVDGLPVAKIKERLNAIRTECEVQANSVRFERLSVERRITQAGMVLRDTTTPR